MVEYPDDFQHIGPQYRLRASAIERAVAAERERCAKIAENLNGWGSPPYPALADHIAKVIRETT